LPVRSMRRVGSGGASAPPPPPRLRLSTNSTPGSAVGGGGGLHPEWGVHNNPHPPEARRGVGLPPRPPAHASAPGVPHDEGLRPRLARLGLGPKVLRRRPDGDDLDIEALIDLFVDLRSGYCPPEHIYLERRKLARNLGVLILLDASGSATDTDPDGLSVHDH